MDCSSQSISRNDSKSKENSLKKESYNKKTNKVNYL